MFKWYRPPVATSLAMFLVLFFLLLKGFMRTKLTFNQRLALELVEWRTGTGQYSVIELVKDLQSNDKNTMALLGSLKLKGLVILQEYGEALNAYNIFLTDIGREELRKEWDNAPVDPARIKQATKELVHSRKLQVLNYYSGNLLACGCCGERHIEFLGVEWIGGAGGKNYLSKRGVGLYEWIVDNGFPVGFIVSCFNCRIVKKGKRAGYLCPHNKSA